MFPESLTPLVELDIDPTPISVRTTIMIRARTRTTPDWFLIIASIFLSSIV
jgi:hypothetical protein